VRTALRLDEVCALGSPVAVPRRFVGVALAQVLDVDARDGRGTEVLVDLRVAVGTIVSWTGR
jgi:hypothetical protein